MNAKRHIIERFGCDETVFDRARLLWLQENAGQCLLLGTRFETMSWNSIGKYIQQACDELRVSGERNV